MKRFLCVLFSMLLLAVCLASCSMTINLGGSPSETETQTEAVTSTAPASPYPLEEATAAKPYIEPTEKELNDLVWMTYAIGGTYDCEAEDAVERAYAVALRYDGLYQNYTSGTAFAKSEFIDSDEADPRDLMFDGKEHPAYAYLKTPAESVDRFMREIMNVEPDHDIEIILEREFPVIYYDDGYYYTRFDIYGNGASPDVYKHSVDDDGWDEVIGGVFDASDENGNHLSSEEPSFSWPIAAKIVLIDGERYWSIKRIG